MKLTPEFTGDLRELLKTTALLHFNEALGYELDPAARYTRAQWERMIEVARGRGREDIAGTLEQLTPQTAI